MRSTLISVLLAASVVAAAFSAASCSSSSAQATGDGGNSSSSSGSSGSSGGSSSGGDDGGASCTANTSDADLMNPSVSFKKDVLPLFEHSCGLSSSCHYDPSNSGNLGIFLGCDITFDAGATSTNSCLIANPGPLVYANLVGGGDAGAPAPLEITGMPYVTPGDPTKSYLMHKVDNDQCMFSNADDAGRSGCVANNKAVLFQQDPPGSLGANDPPNWCGTSMPLNGGLLPAGPVCGGSQDCSGINSYARDTIRAWIAQGAMND